MTDFKSKTTVVNSSANKVAVHISNEWAGTESEIIRHLEQQNKQCLGAYRENPLLVSEHANIERSTSEGGYGRRQIYELVQNGADALLGCSGGRIHVILTSNALYCANEGKPITTEGLDAILSSHLSVKRGREIGRFGLGFKSVLGVSTSPEIYSRSGSFGFDAAGAERQIRPIVPNAEHYPILRLAHPLDPHTAATRDPVLVELMTWAATVIKVPRVPSSSKWLTIDIEEFPSGFLLFSPHVGNLILEDLTTDNFRDIRLQKRGNRIQLEEDGTSSEWQVFSTDHTPSAAARKDAGELAERETIPLMWAVPLRGKAAGTRGEFWAFFPTEYKTTLSGILNAPWKTNEDRHSLLRGDFNQELISAASKLIAYNLNSIEHDDDLGRFLDLIPARGAEAPNWADEELTKAVYDVAALEPVVPDQNGNFRRATELFLHPAKLPKEALESWAMYPARPVNWTHHSVDTRERRSRIDRLFTLAGNQASSIAAWLEALVTPKNPQSSLAAVITAAKVLVSPDATAELLSEISEAQIILSRDEQLVRAKHGTIFIHLRESAVPPNIKLVHEFLTSSPEGLRSLTALGISEVEAASELEAMLHERPLAKWPASKWEIFWRLTERVPLERVIEILKKYTKEYGDQDPLHVRTFAGQFRPVHRVLLPGAVVPEDQGRDTQVCVDVHFHARGYPILREIGCTDTPRLGPINKTGIWYEEYRNTILREYLLLLANRNQHPQTSYLEFENKDCVGPLEPLYDLSDQGRALFTAHLLQTVLETNSASWTVGHTTKSQIPKMPCDSPSVWVARKEGRFETSTGIRRIIEAVGPTLRELDAVFPVARCSEQISKLARLPNSLETISTERWKAAFKRAEDVQELRTLGIFYAAAVRHSEYIPQTICCQEARSFAVLSPASVAVTSEWNAVAALEQTGKPFLFVESPETARLLIERWGLQSADDLVSVKLLFAVSGPETPLLDRFSGLETHITDEQNRIKLVPCAWVRQDTVTADGTVGQERNLLRAEDTIYFADKLSNRELLAELTHQLNIVLAPADFDLVLEEHEENRARQRLAAIRSKQTLAEKLLAAVGVEAIRPRLPKGLIPAAETEYGKVSALKVAELALAVHGVEILQEFREEFARARLKPPVQWAGNHEARRFVELLGFPKEFAGFPQVKRDRMLEVEGPPDLPPLHTFQKVIVENTLKMLSPSSKKRRGLLSLPTGAGKTRVAVQALVGAMSDGVLTSPVLWIAQSDELCEQAVQTWSEVWRGLGPRAHLQINRLWAQNEAEAGEDTRQVVVATIDKLHSRCVDNRDYSWLAAATCVIIDEAHGSIAKEYTRVLDWLGLGRGKDRCPLIGLTATPFSGGKDKTQDLVNRYFGNRLDKSALGKDPYAKLQKMKVLAEVDHELLDGIDVKLTPAELKNLETLKRAPASVEMRIGEDPNRNRTLLDHIRSLPDDWPVLLFAASVDHARTMAALLSAGGISAAAVSGDTLPGARRNYIEQFRAGKIRVLTNYGVLTAGFDAPSVRALYVARPTYSPVLYQQMIGRGLRGPKNGGKERCLIVNVKDNFKQYGERLSFYDFEPLWKNNK